MNSSVKQRLLLLGGVVLFAILLLLPTVNRDFGNFWKLSKPLSLGLDLSGGVHLVYRVLAKEAVKSQLQTIGNSVRTLLRTEKIAATRAKALNESTLEVVVLNDSLAERARSKIEEEYPFLQFREKVPEGDRVKLLYTMPDARATQIQSQAVEQAVETLRNRVDQFGVAEPLIQRIGTDRVQLQMPGFSDIERVKKVVGDVAKLEFRLVPAGDTSNAITLKERDGNSIKVEEQVLMTGDAVQDATVSVGTDGSGVGVHLKLNSEGAKTFRQITSENVGRQLAIILDDVVYSAPTIQETIGGGEASISGRFSGEEAKNLRTVLRSGALPAPLEVVEERTVGPTLGKESIRSGVLAILGGFVAIMLFMAWYYRKAGYIAMGTLALNLILLVAALSLFGATLTLPGLAGLALTIGMAVDSNVIVFERIRDELRNGASRDVAVRTGFDKAYSAIVDTNVTVLVSGIILFLFGTGPVRGFAVTLALGVLTTMFCAVFAARLAFDVFPLRGRKGLSI